MTAEWDAVAPALARYGEVLTMELSLSNRAGGGGPLGAAVAALDQALGGGTEPPVLIGHSMGAVASLMLGATYPDRLAGLVLTAPFVPLARNGRSSLVTAADYAHHRLLFLADSASRRRQRPGAVDVNLATRAGGLAALARYGLRPAAFHAIADRVTCPVLVVHGRDDHYVPAAFALGAAARHPSWQLDLIPGSGHFPHRDDPDAWLASVEPFLQQLVP